MLRPQTNRFRTAYDLPGVWGFRLDPDDTGRAQGWENGIPAATAIGVPGSWNEQLPAARDELGPAWYECRFDAPALDGEVALRFGAVHYLAEVWLNGEALGGHEGGQLPFALPVRALRGRDNLLVVRVDARLRPDRVPPGLVPEEHRFARDFLPPAAFDFFPFAGIHRKVELVAAPRDGIRDVSTWTELDGSDAAAILHVDVEHGTGEVALELDGETCAAPLRIPDARLWSPDDPHLRTLVVTLVRDGAPVDEVTLRIGLRTVAVDGDRILLNGAPVELRGFGRHEDFPVLGRGASTAVAARDLQLMRDLGANSFRTGHYPHDEDTLDLADRLGILVVSETPSVALFFAEEGLERRQELALGYVDELVARDRNRACVIAWSVANEPHPHDAAAGALLVELCARAKELDPTRPVTYGSHAFEDPGLGGVDFVSLNRYPAWYVFPGDIEGGIEPFAAELDAVHARYGKPILLSEFGADAMAGAHADPPAMWSEEYQAALIERVLDVADARPFVAGAHVWVFADFATAQAEHRPHGLNFKGVFTRDRRPKLAAHRLKARWRGQTP